MAKDVHSAFTDVLEKFLSHQGDSSKKGSEATLASQPALEEAKVVLMKMKEEGRYLVDAW